MVTVIMPTCNRSECIQYFFDKCIRDYKGTLFSFEFHDSSNNDLTKDIVENGIKMLCNLSIQYFRYDFNISGDDKAIFAIKNVYNDYFWLMGDGNVVDFNKLEKLLMENQYFKYDVLNIEALHRKGHLNQDKKFRLNQVYEVNDPVLYAEKYFSHLTYWGAAIIRKSFFRCNYEDKTVTKYQCEKIPWWIACLIFESCNKQKEIVLGTVYTNFVGYNPMKKDHGWIGGGKYYDYTFKKFNRAIELLPDTYSDIKMCIIKRFRQDSLVSYGYLIHLRYIGILNYHLVKKYKHDIDKVDGFYRRLMLISFLPKSIAGLIDNIKNSVKNFLQK